MNDHQQFSRPKTPKSIDWDQIRSCLTTAQAAFERGWEQNPEEKKKTLKARAKLLAQEEKKAAHQESIEIVEFLLAYEQYGLESSYIREVSPLRELTPLPCTPPFMLGIINVRGQILSVIDLKKFFDLPEKGLTDLNKVIIVRADGMELGILADAVLGVRTIPLPEIQMSLPTLTGKQAEYLRGVTKERLVVLDINKIILDSSLTICEEVDG